MPVQNFRVYDTETTGLSAHNDQIIQFAGVALDSDLNLIKNSEIVLDISLRPDVVPSPHAFAVHGISIQDTLSKGMPEFEAANHMRNWFMAAPDSMMTGYNTLRFDDEHVRNTMYRTLFDPYEHEYKNGNTRSDILRLVMLVYALRPEILNWGVNKDGRDSLKLGDMAAANGITLDNAHDARYDVMATIDIMRIIRKGNPRLWDYFLNLSDKKFVKPIVESLNPLVLVDPYLAREQGHMTLALPVIYDAASGQKMLCVDLRNDPTELLTLTADEIQRRVFTPMADLPAGESLAGVIRDMTVNKQPLIVEPSILKGRPDILDRAALDMDMCMRHAEMISKDKGFRQRLQAACAADYPPCDDVYQGIYSLGFIQKAEHTLRSKARALEPAKNDEKQLPNLVNLDPHDFAKGLSRDTLRLFELTTRAKWANFAEQVISRDSFRADDLKEWTDHLNRIWFEPVTARNAINLDGFQASLAEVKATLALNSVQEKALDELEAYVSSNLTMIEGLNALLEQKACIDPQNQNDLAVAGVSELESTGRTDARSTKHDSSGLEPGV
jgi:exodeoxyribonuclease I